MIHNQNKCVFLSSYFGKKINIFRKIAGGNGNVIRCWNNIVISVFIENTMKG